MTTPFSQRSNNLFCSLIFAGILAAFGLSMTALPVHGQSIEPSAVETPARTGKQVYYHHCASCHGLDGKGAAWTGAALGKPPTSFSDYRRESVSKNQMVNSVTSGRPDQPRMPQFGRLLERKEIEDVIDFIRATYMSGDDVDVASLFAETSKIILTPYPGNMSGNQERGKILYELSCVACHGVNGAGDGPRSGLIIPPLRPLWNGAAQEPKDVFRAIAEGRVGTAMSAWRSVFHGQQIADLSEYLIAKLFKDKITETTNNAYGLDDNDQPQARDLQRFQNNAAGPTNDLATDAPITDLPDAVGDGFDVIGTVNDDGSNKAASPKADSPPDQATGPAMDEDGFMVIGTVDDGPATTPPSESPKEGSNGETSGLLEKLADESDLGLNALEELEKSSQPEPAPESLAPENSSQDPITNRGRQAYAKHCAVCHGADGRGKTPTGQALNPPAPDLPAKRQAVTLDHASSAMGGQINGYKKDHDFRKALGPLDIGDIAVYLIDKVIPGRDRLTFHTEVNGWPNHRETFSAAYPFVDGRLSAISDLEKLDADQKTGLELYRQECEQCHGAGIDAPKTKLQWQPG